MGISKKRKVFFFEKKKQKTFVFGSQRTDQTATSDAARNR